MLAARPARATLRLPLRLALARRAQSNTPVPAPKHAAPPAHFAGSDSNSDSDSNAKDSNTRSFSLTAFLFKASLVTAALYVTGASAALIYEPLQDPYVEYLPGGEVVLDKVEYVWKNRKDIQNFEYREYAKSKYAEFAHTVNSSADKLGLQDYIHLSHDKIHPSNPHISQSLKDKLQLQYDKTRERDQDKYIVISNSDPVPEAASAPATASSPKHHPIHSPPAFELPTITIASSDSHVKAVVDSLNALIDQFNSASISGESSKVVDAININLAKLSQVFESYDVNALANEKLASMKDQFELEKTAIVKSLASTAEQTKLALQEKHQQILSKEIEELKKNFQLEYENKLKTQELELIKSINETIAEKIESERNGKLKDLSSLTSRVDSIAKLETQLSKVAQSYTTYKEINHSISRINALLTSNSPSDVRGSNLVDELTKLRQLTKPLNNQLIDATLKAFPSDKELLLNGGVLTQSQIISRWELVVPQLRSVSLLPENPGVLGFMSSAIFSKLIWSKSGVPVETNDDYIGNDVESVVARVSDHLHKNKLDEAVEEVTSLKGVPRTIAKDWIEDTRRKLEIQFLLDILATEVNVSA